MPAMRLERASTAPRSRGSIGQFAHGASVRALPNGLISQTSPNSLRQDWPNVHAFRRKGVRHMNRYQTVRPEQKYTAKQFDMEFPDEDSCLEYVKEQRWPDGR